MYAVPAAQWPSIAATCGTTPLIVTCSRNRWPASANVEPVDGLDARAGRVEEPDDRDALAQRDLAQTARSCAHRPCPSDPAITVKSYAQTATRRPSMSRRRRPCRPRRGSPSRPRSPGPSSRPAARTRRRVRVEQQVDSLPDRQLSHRALPFDERGAAHRGRHAHDARSGPGRAASSRGGSADRSPPHGTAAPRSGTPLIPRPSS